MTLRTYTRTQWIVMGLAMLALVAALVINQQVSAPTAPTAPTVRISRADLGARWPLTVDAGTIVCDGTAIVLRTDRGLFAVNGTARGRITDMGWKDIADITAPDPSNAGGLMNVQPIIDRGLQICH